MILELRKLKGKKGRCSKVGVSGEAEFADVVIIDGNIYLENELPTEVVDDLPEVIDEDLLYEAYRDEKFERRNLRGNK